MFNPAWIMAGMQAAQNAPKEINGRPQPRIGKSTGYNLPLDPLGVNQNPWMGAFFNPLGEAVMGQTPAPFFDPAGYAAGMYKPHTLAGKMMNYTNDPLGLFTKGRFGIFNL